MDTPVNLNTALAIFIVAGMVVFTFLLSQLVAWYRLSRWARREGFRLVDFRSAFFWQGPRAWQRTRAKQDYHVVVEGPSGRRRSGWVMRTETWLGFGPTEYKVEWDADLG
jgi:hypothetical protein